MLTILNTADVPDLVVAYQNQAATYQLADATRRHEPHGEQPQIRPDRRRTG